MKQKLRKHLRLAFTCCIYILRPSLVPRLLWFSAGEEPEYEANCRPAIGRNVSCAVGDFAYHLYRPSREMWFIDCGLTYISVHCVYVFSHALCIHNQHK